MAGQSPASHQAAKPRREDIDLEGRLRTWPTTALFAERRSEVQW